MLPTNLFVNVTVMKITIHRVTVT